MAEKSAPVLSNETAAAIELLAKSLKPQGPLEMAGLPPEEIDRLTKPPVPKRWRRIACRSAETGASFIALVVESRAHKHGRIVELGGYQHPRGVATYMSQGGLVPDGHPILRDANVAPPNDGAELPKHMYSQMYLQWRWSEFWQRDLAHYVSRGLEPHMCAEPSGFEAKWNEGLVRPLKNDDE